MLLTLRETRPRLVNTVPIQILSLTIHLPPQRVCSLCGRMYPVVDLQTQIRHTRGRCSRCNKLKKTKHFVNPKPRSERFKTCNLVATRMEQVNATRGEAAHAVGLRWCTSGSHPVTAAACTSADDTLLSSCLTCLERRHPSGQGGAYPQCWWLAAKLDDRYPSLYPWWFGWRQWDQ